MRNPVMKLLWDIVKFHITSSQTPIFSFIFTKYISLFPFYKLITERSSEILTNIQRPSRI